jgi:hypothetical protein
VRSPKGVASVYASTLIRLSGLAAVVAGVVLIVVELMELFAVDIEHLRAASDTVAFAFWAGLSLLTFLLLPLGLIGIYAHQLEAAGFLGLAGFLVAFLGTVLSAGAAWTIFFIAPKVAPLVPTFVEIPWFELSFLLFALGWLLFGVATLRARVFPRAAAVLLIIGAVLIAVPLPARALVLGVALAWLGFVLFAGGGAARPSQPERVR